MHSMSEIIFKHEIIPYFTSPNIFNLWWYKWLHRHDRSVCRILCTLVVPPPNTMIILKFQIVERHCQQWTSLQQTSILTVTGHWTSQGDWHSDGTTLCWRKVDKHQIMFCNDNSLSQHCQHCDRLSQANRFSWILFCFFQ